MELKPHKDLVRGEQKNRGYAIRIGKKVPNNSANLAYVQSKAVSPEDNILLEDVSSHIEENGLLNFTDTDYLVYPQTDFLLETEAGQSAFPTDTVHITDEFTVRKNRQDNPKPVFYSMLMAGSFDARSAEVLPYLGGYSTVTEQEAVTLSEIPQHQREQLLYTGSSIRIEMNGTPLKDEEAYKIILQKDEDDLYRINVLTNFQNREGKTYKVVYPNTSFKTPLGETIEEVLNAYPFFEQVTPDQFDATVQDMQEDPDNYKHLKIYSVKEKENSFNIYATSDMMIADYKTRAPQLFRHRVEAKLKTKLSETNPGTMNIGFLFVDEVSNVESLLSVGKVLSEHSMLPSYLTLDNPHPTDMRYLKTDLRYWTVDLNMPDHHYEDYDMLIISGYGKKDLSAFKEKLDHYMENGGTIWVDNAGNSFNVLDFGTSKGTSFISDIGFSSSSNEFGVKEIVKQTPYSNRLYPVINASALGYEDVAPAIVFGANEEGSQWSTLVKHLNGGPSVISRTVLEKGTLLVSNCGFFRSLYHNREGDENTNFIMNVIVNHAEDQWVFTPWRNEFVYHRENLFAQEYKVSNADVYINDRNDYNQNEIVAKKILHSNSKEFVKGYCKPWFYNATGTYFHKIDGDKAIAIKNQDFESGKVTQAGVPVVQWTADELNAIPAWNTKKLAGREVVFKHNSGMSPFGVRQISLNSTDAEVGAQAYWESERFYLAADEYLVSAWLNAEKVTAITTDGAKVGIYNTQGEKIAASLALSGNHEWKKLQFNFNLDKPQDINIRLGFVDGNGYGIVNFDNIEMQSAGTVRGVAESKGEKALYAFSVKPNPTTIDIEAEGFGNADITRATPEVPFTYSITPFVLEWYSFGFDEAAGKEIGRYGRTYGDPVSYATKIRKTDGLKSLGYLHAMLPGIPAGKQWYDKNKVFYKIQLGSESQAENELVNIKLFNRDTGMEWFYSNELVVGYMDIFGGTIRPSYVLHAETGYETIRASKRNFGMKLMDKRRIYSELPQTKDAKENWYLRIHNGQFTKEKLGYKEWLELYANDQDKLMEKYQARVMKKENYSIKEYDAQIFNPSIGLKTVENELEYLTPNTVKVPHTNLNVYQGTINSEQLLVEGASDERGTLFRSSTKNWLRNGNVTIHVDPAKDGFPYEIFEEYPFEINYEEGTVFFPGQRVAYPVYAGYDYCNFAVYRRNYKNFRVTDDILTGKIYDTKTKETSFYGSKGNWLIQPTPVLKTSAGKATAANIIPPTSYRIDYETGRVIFKFEPVDTIYADYGYFENEQLNVKDFDAQNGIFLLENGISFKDDIYAKYSYYDEFYEYKGFHNPALNTFLHLDLNPSVGHYSTLPMVTHLDGKQKVEYRNVSSVKLLNKVIHIYMVPDSVGGHSVRHCFSSQEWRTIQRSNPMYLLLAKVQVREHTNVNDVVVMDARTRGGGVAENLSVKTIEQRVKGKQRYWDIGNWDGKAFYRNGVLIVSIPKSILKEYGGTLTEEYVKESIDKHVAFGTYCIIEWEGAE